MLSRDDVRHIARLAALRIDDDQVEVMRQQLSDILRHFNALVELDTEGVEPTGHATDSHSVMREDIALPPLERNDALANAPHVDGEFVRVMPVLE